LGERIPHFRRFGRCPITTESIGRRRPSRHMWTAPVGKRYFDALIPLVSFSHMSGLLMRVSTAGPDDIRQALVPIIATSSRLVTGVGVSSASGGDRWGSSRRSACQTVESQTAPRRPVLRASSSLGVGNRVGLEVRLSPLLPFDPLAERNGDGRRQVKAEAAGGGGRRPAFTRRRPSPTIGGRDRGAESPPISGFALAAALAIAHTPSRHRFFKPWRISPRGSFRPST
jgi:hypothetical protein